MGEQKRRGERFAELDGLRGLAAISLLVGHYTTTFDTTFNGHPAPGAQFPYGTYGVQLFFMISGFVIFMAAWRVRRPSTFAISRVSRLYPAYWTALAIGLVVAFAWPAMPDPPLGQIAANATMVERWFLVPEVNDMTWVLTVEIQFYLAVFVLLLITRSQLTQRVALITMSGFALVGTTIALNIGDIVRSTPHNELPRAITVILDVVMPEYMPLFAVGCFAYLWRTRALSAWWPVGATALAAVAAASLHGVTAGLAIGAVGTIFLVGLFARPVPLLRAGPLNWVGRRSYSLLLLHTVLGYPAIAALCPLLGRNRAMIAAAAITLISTVIVYELAEVRGTALMRRTLMRISDRTYAHRPARAVLYRAH